MGSIKFIKAYPLFHSFLKSIGRYIKSYLI